MSSAHRHDARVSGLAALLLTRLLPRDELARRLDLAGFRGGHRAERIREEVMTTFELLAEHGAAWHAAHRGADNMKPGFNESDASDSGQQSLQMDAISQQEAAELLGITRQRVGQLRDRGELNGSRDRRGQWMYDLSEVDRLAAERARREVNA